MTEGEGGSVIARSGSADRGNLQTTDAQNADCHVAQELAPRNGHAERGLSRTERGLNPAQRDDTKGEALGVGWD